jgi:hypothetical protein
MQQFKKLSAVFFEGIKYFLEREIVSGSQD